MGQIFSTAIVIASVVMLSACVSTSDLTEAAGSSNTIAATNAVVDPATIASELPVKPSGNPSIVDPLTDGSSISKSLKNGTTFNAPPTLSTRFNYNSKTQKSFVGTAGYASVKQNLSGGYDIIVLRQRSSPGLNFSVGYADEKSGGDSWEKITKDLSGKTLYTTTLWNAGKGGIEGLGTDQNGQTFHKILGYFVYDHSKEERNRGHIVFGTETDPSRLDSKTKTATYDGYFYTNVSPTNGLPPEQAMAVTGGLRMVADFDANTISGQSTSFQLRQAGESSFNGQSNTVWLKPTSIRNEASSGANPGVAYSGDLNSDFSYMNGRYTGNFFGGNAQETAGTFSGENGDGITEGYFTTVVSP